VGEFVGDEAIQVAIAQGILGEDGRVVHGGGRRVLHAASAEVPDDELRVTVPRVGLIEELGEVIHHPRRAAGGGGDIAAAAGRDVDGHGDLGSLGRHIDDIELANNERDEIVDVGLVLQPVECVPGVGAFTRALRGLDLAAVGTDQVAGGDGDDQLGCETYIREVVAGEPVAVGVGFALGMDLGRAAGPGRRFGRPDHARGRVGRGVGRDDFGRGTRSQRRVEGDRELLAVGPRRRASSVRVSTGRSSALMLRVCTAANRGVFMSGISMASFMWVKPTRGWGG
jgi:hypothetical protein